MHAQPVSSVTRPPVASAAPERVFGLDVYRTVAILMVTCSHGLLAYNLKLVVREGFPFLAPLEPLILLTEHWGALGVELFFVLSGFLIGRILAESDQSWSARQVGHFLVRRWFRTLPVFWLAVAGNWAMETWWRHRQLGFESVATHTLFLRNLWRPRFEFMPEAWSLAVEEWFYLVVPCLLYVAARLARGTSPTKRFLTVIVLIGAVSLGLRTLSSFDPQADWVQVQRCSTLLRFDALMIGVGAAWLSLRFPVAWERWAIACAVTGVALTYAAYGPMVGLPGPHFGDEGLYARVFRFSVLSTGLALLLPIASAWKSQKDTAFHSLVRLVAASSYAMYLLNWPLFQATMHPSFTALFPTWWSQNLLFAGKQALLIVLSYLLYRNFERPITKLRDRFAPEGR